ncbi:BamA/TamA family outer membrane protein [Enterobacteriaceae endosymbiont of Macroplea appendiculata]|uniref:BamA/TamA family outer membrane protein n=1 Tax=Enterobacteriaceae endosymbiont of Macroplea appendiculata TaxID=2675790 RepID=UPI0014493B35|nr:BamA/TamA family outer membrane protein [Enterobacteriaceae endosymbiont of Macroplea appendiculata]QJC30839.1 BamA/TamA family outer membrane protein [Enterobacteriaceae endosymbiont of Macroplea appendiculata]
MIIQKYYITKIHVIYTFIFVIFINLFYITPLQAQLLKHCNYKTHNLLNKISNIPQQKIKNTILFIGNKKISSYILYNIIYKLKITRFNIIDKEKIFLLKKYIKHIYNIYGIPNIAIFIIKDDKIYNKIYIFINEIGKVKIQRINIIGNSAFTQQILLKNINLYFMKLGYYFGLYSYNQQLISRIIHDITHFYIKQGFLKFQITNIKYNIIPHKHSINLDVFIKENQLYILKKVFIHINSKQLIKPIHNISNLYLNQTYQTKKILILKKKIINYLIMCGFLHPTIMIYKSYNITVNNMVLHIYINTGMKYYVRYIKFIHNKIIPEYLLQNNLLHKEHHILNLNLIKQTKNKLKQLEYIQDVSVLFHNNHDKLNSVDVIYNIHNNNTNMFNFNFGLNNNKFMLNAYLQKDNFLGKANNLLVIINKSVNEFYWNVLLIKPYIFYKNISMGIKIFFHHPEKNMNFIDIKKGIYTILKLPIYSTHFAIKNYIGLLHHQIRHFTTSIPIYVTNYYTNKKQHITFQKKIYSLIEYNIKNFLIFNTLNHQEQPTKGILAILSFNFSILQKIYYNNYKLMFKYNQYIPIYIKILNKYHKAYIYLINFIIRSKIGYINSPTNNTYIFPEMMWMNHNNIVRGIKPNIKFQKNSYHSINHLRYINPVSYNDNIMFQLTTELKFSIPPYIPMYQYLQNFKPLLFFDIGSIWHFIYTKNILSKLDVTYKKNFFTELRSSIGFVLKYKTPLGVITFTCSYPLKKSIHDQIQLFQFTIENN